jgi:2-hydroxy fatty acid dioxygenase
MKQSKSLIKKYHFYEKYHQNFYNKLVHILCIPMLVWTTTVFLTYIPSFVLTLGNYTFNLTVSGLIATLYVSYYLYLDFELGLISSFLFFLNVLSSSYFVQNNSLSYSLGMSLSIHLISWTLQILSHKYFEGNKPALLDSITQSFSIAPLFTLLEFLFLFGFRKDLDKKLNLYKKLIEKSE